jgi:hypothetical protein
MTAHLSQGALRAAFFAPAVLGAAGAATFLKLSADDHGEVSASQKLVPLAAGGGAMLAAVPVAMAADYLMFRHGSTRYIVDGAEQITRQWSPLRMGAVGEAVTAVIAGAGIGVFASTLGSDTSIRGGS